MSPFLFFTHTVLCKVLPSNLKNGVRWRTKSFNFAFNFLAIDILSFFNYILNWLHWNIIWFHKSLTIHILELLLARVPTILEKTNVWFSQTVITKDPLAPKKEELKAIKTNFDEKERAT